MIEVAIICTSITTSFTLMTLKRLLPSIQLVPVIEIPLGVQHAETVGIRMLEMLMRPLLAGRHPGNLHAGRSQIEIKLDPEPPTKMPAGSNDEHLTRKPPIPVSVAAFPCLLWHPRCTDWFAFVRERGRKGRHEADRAPAT